MRSSALWKGDFVASRVAAAGSGVLASDGPHVGRVGAGQRRHALEVGAGDVGECDWEIRSRKTLQSGGKPIDRVVFRRERAVSARVLHRQRERRVDFFGGLHIERGHLSASQFASAGVDVDGVVGIDEVAAVRQQPRDAVVGSAFFVGRQREDQIAVGHPLFLSQSNERRDERRRPAFQVERPAAVEVAVLFGQDERVHGPVFAPCLDDVEVGDEERRASACPCRGSGPRGCPWLPLRRALNDDDIGLGEAGREEPRRHPLGRDRRAAGRMRRVGFDQLFQDRAAHLLVVAGRLRAQGNDGHEVRNECNETSGSVHIQNIFQRWLAPSRERCQPPRLSGH